MLDENGRRGTMSSATAVGWWLDKSVKLFVVVRRRCSGE